MYPHQTLKTKRHQSHTAAATKALSIINQIRRPMSLFAPNYLQLIKLIVCMYRTANIMVMFRYVLGLNMFRLAVAMKNRLER